MECVIFTEVDASENIKQILCMVHYLELFVDVEK